jgi:hypothetical protein
MSTQNKKTVYVRRGNRIQGPVPLSQIKSLIDAAKVMPTDDVAESLSGPWIPVSKLIKKATNVLATIDSVTIRSPSGHVSCTAIFECPNCRNVLKSTAAEADKANECPKCGLRYRLSERACAQLLQGMNHAKSHVESGSAGREHPESNSTAIHETHPPPKSVWPLRRPRLTPLTTTGIVGVIAVGAVLSCLVVWLRSNTPGATFETFAAGKLRNIAMNCPLIPVNNVDLALRRTDSITSPYTGTLTFRTVQRIEQQKWGRGYVVEGDVDCELDFEQRDRTWAFQKATLQCSNWVVKKDGGEANAELAAKVAAGMNRDGVPTQVIRDDWNRLIEAFSAFGHEVQGLTHLTPELGKRLGDSFARHFDFYSIRALSSDAMEALVEARKALVDGSTPSLLEENKWSTRWTGTQYGGLELVKLSTLQESEAAVISRFNGSVRLGVESLSDAAAQSLGEHMGGRLDLSSLKSLSPQAAISLAKHVDDITLGVPSLPDEALLDLAKDASPAERHEPKNRKKVELPYLKILSKAGAAAVIASPCHFDLSGMETITSVELARKLLDDSETLGATHWSAQIVSDEVAELLAEHPAKVTLRELHSLTSASLARKLLESSSQYRSDGTETLSLIRLEELSVAAACALAEFSGGLEIGNREAFDPAPDVVAALAQHTGKLGVKMRALTPATASALAAHKGELWIEVNEEVPRPVRDLLTSHAGRVVVKREKPPFIWYEGGSGSPIVSDGEPTGVEPTPAPQPRKSDAMPGRPQP